MIIKTESFIRPLQKAAILAILERNNLLSREINLYNIPAILSSTKLPQPVLEELRALPGITAITKDLLSSRAFKTGDTLIPIGNSVIGGKEISIIAGPCSVESQEQIFQIAEFLKHVGVKFIRGGAYKPRTSPYDFQGLGLEGLKLIRQAADAYGLKVVTEIMDTSLIEEVYPYADILQIGSRNMQNYFFLRQIGKTDKPILLKRGMYSRMDEWMMAADYILSEGNGNLMLCERGIRTFDTSLRNTMDIAAIPFMKQLSHLPVFADPSHGTGRRSLIAPLSMAAIAAGADGLMIEIHPHPEKAWSDGIQSLNFEQFKKLLRNLLPIAQAAGRSLGIYETSIKETEKSCAE